EKQYTKPTKWVFQDGQLYGLRNGTAWMLKPEEIDRIFVMKPSLLMKGSVTIFGASDGRPIGEEFSFSFKKEDSEKVANFLLTLQQSGIMIVVA
ncbi:MAG: hypothetical protein II867_04625, partial [Clostridia bacterium]|nr:hypothetical protein [Clostridia bacterium]